MRLLRDQPDPNLHAGDPVRISGFVLQRPGMQPQLARLTVRCCLADATPAGLAIEWPEQFDPKPDQWLEIEGTMTTQILKGELINVVKPNTITSIVRPDRPWNHELAGWWLINRQVQAFKRCFDRNGSCCFGATAVPSVAWAKVAICRDSTHSFGRRPLMCVSVA